jgi:hypothetical protein
MRFHAPLIALRQRGKRPESVFLLVDCTDAEDGCWPERDSGHARIAIDATDDPKRLDLRFLVGSTVHVQGFDERRIEAAFRAAVTAGAAQVAAVFGGEVHIHQERSHGRSAA